MQNISKFLTCAVIAASAAALSACGGTAAEATVGGTVAGLSGGTSVVLLLNGSDPISVGGDVSFTFDQQVSSGSGYAVTIQTQPLGEICVVSNGSGTIDGEGDDVTNVVVNCYASGTQPTGS